MAMLERAATLRQWGLRWHRVGVLVRRAEEPKLELSVLEALLAQAAIAGLAGIAVTGPAAALAPLRSGGPTGRRSRAVPGVVRGMMGWGGAA